MKGQPIFLAIPQADVNNLRAFQGDPTVTSRVIGASSRDVGRLCAVLLRGLEPGDRRDALRVASAESSGPQVQSVPIAALLPSDAAIEDLAQLWSGLMLMLLALGTSSADTSVGSVVANATAMASGAPFASDPAGVERQNEVLLAKAILEAALLDDEQAKRWFEDNHLVEALKSVAAGAKSGTSDTVPFVRDALARLEESYDCYRHHQPMGGDAGGSNGLAQFWTDLWDNAKNAFDDGVKIVSQGAPVVAAQNAQNELDDQMLSDSVSRAVAAVSSAKKAMEDGDANLADYREKLRSATLQQAKLQWAHAILSAPEEVATILSAANPNMSDAGSFLQSMLSTLPAAKSTGNLGTIKALIYALKAASSRGDGSAESLYSLLSGAPDKLVSALEQLIIDANTASLESLLSKQAGDRSAIAQIMGRGSDATRQSVMEQVGSKVKDDAVKVANESLRELSGISPKQPSVAVAAEPSRRGPAVAQASAAALREALPGAKLK